MKIRKILSYLFIVMLLFSISIVISGQENKRYEGKPSYSAGMPKRFVIWENNDVFRLRTTTKKKLRVFSGFICAVNGTFNKVGLIRLDKGDVVKLSKDKNVIYFRFITKKGVDGFNFKTDAEKLVYDLYIDKKRCKPLTEIFLGEKGKHPLKNPFFLNIENIEGSSGSDDEEIPSFDVSVEDSGEEVVTIISDDELEEEDEASD